MFARMARFTACAALALAAGTARADSKAAPDMDALMKEWAKWSSPGAPHQLLQKMAGKWTLKQKTWMDPSQPPMETTGTAELAMVLGGRFLQQHYTGTMMGMPFEGSGLVGYDNFRQMYTSSWADNMGTAMMQSHGAANAAGTEITLNGLMDEPATGEKDKKMRQVLRVTGPDAFVFELYNVVPGQGDMKVLEITHTRAK